MDEHEEYAVYANTPYLLHEGHSIEDVEKEIRTYCGSDDQPSYENIAIDLYWSKVNVVEYPFLCQLAKAVLSCFSGQSRRNIYNYEHDFNRL